MMSIHRFAVPALFSLVTMLIVASFALAQDDEDKKTEKFFANIGGGGARAVELTISQWSTASQRARLLGALDTGGQEAMIKILETLPKVGTVRLQGGRYASTAVHYAFESKTSEGKRHIVALTPRPISLNEAQANNQSLDFDLSMIELLVPDDGKKGNGAIVAGAQIEIDEETKRLKVTAYQATPTKLVNVYTN